MFNKTLRWILPFLVIALIAVYLVLAPALSTHAAAPQLQQHHAVTHYATPKRFWHP
ncbi:MAG: hypothetical protein ABI396_12440 [Ktedonobacteraceae bacterium]